MCLDLILAATRAIDYFLRKFIDVRENSTFKHCFAQKKIKSVCLKSNFDIKSYQQKSENAFNNRF